MNDDGYCQKCSVVGCTFCETGKEYSCEECGQSMMKDGEVCVCQNEAEKLILRASVNYARCWAVRAVPLATHRLVYLAETG